MVVHFLSGVVADVASSVIYTPTEIIKQNLQVQSPHPEHGLHFPKYHGAIDAAKKLVGTHGVRRGLFRGWWLHIASDAPVTALYFVFFHS